MGNTLAKVMTTAMATWTFIGTILVLCLLEILGNLWGWFHFDPTMLVLNTILSLWAAVQGSIIMINQNLADKDRDAMLGLIIQLNQQIMAHEESVQASTESILALEEAIKKSLEKKKFD